MIVKNHDKSITVIASCKRSFTAISSDIIGRAFNYSNGKNKENFILAYNNENATKPFFKFAFKNDNYIVNFDDNYTILEIVKEGELVAKREKAKSDDFIFEVEEKFEKDVWLWFVIFQHLDYHMPRTSLLFPSV